MPRIPLSNSAGDPYYRLIGHRPEILKAWAALDVAFLGESSTLSVHLKEEVRKVLAQEVGCRYCASLGLPGRESLDARESLAVAFAEMVVKDHKAIDDGMIAVMREEFTDPELMELIAWLCFKYGSNMLGAITGLEPADGDDVEGYKGFLDRMADESATQPAPVPVLESQPVGA